MEVEITNISVLNDDDGRDKMIFLSRKRSEVAL